VDDQRAVGPQACTRVAVLGNEPPQLISTPSNLVIRCLAIDTHGLGHEPMVPRASVAGVTEGLATTQTPAVDKTRTRHFVRGELHTAHTIGL
jgi:hypothetical protein